MRVRTIMGFLFVLAATSSGQTPLSTGFTYQGQLKQSGSPMTGTANLDFSLWNDAAATAPANKIGSSQSLAGVSVSNGLFTVQLNAGGQFGVTAFNGDKRWLEIAVNGTTLSPRQEITATPYARFSTAPWASSGGNISYSAGNVGIGTSSPFYKLDVRTSDSVSVFGQNDSGNGGIAGVWGYATDATSPITSYGVLGISEGWNGSGVNGVANHPSGITYGVFGKSESTSGIGVYGWARAASGTTYGVYGLSGSPTGYAGYFDGRGYFSGSVGIGTTNPGFPLTVSTPIGYGLVHTDGTRTIGTYVNSTGGWLGTRSNHPLYLFTNDSSPLVTLAPGGNFGIGVLSPTFQLQLSSNSAAKPTSNAWTIASDRRLKKNITPIEGALDQLMRLHGVTYQWIHPETQGNMTGTYTGMIAQDVEKVFPEWISADKDGYKHLTVIGFEGLAVEALRDLRREKDQAIAALRKEKDHQIAALENKNAELTRRLERMERIVSRLASDDRPGIVATNVNGEKP